MEIKNNKVNLCHSCQYEPIKCTADDRDVIFGDREGNTNICCCRYYEPLQTKSRKQK